MKNPIIAAAVSAALLIAPQLADAAPKQGWYLGMGAGAGFLENSDVKSGGVTNKLEFDPGYVFSGSVGYAFDNNLRPEFEINYRRNNVSKATGATSGADTGSEDAIGFMGNLFYDFDTRTMLTPYIGAGLGGALVGADNAGSVFSGDNIDRQPFMFAYQVIGGLAYELSENLDATIDYRYFRTLEPDFKTRSGANVDDALYANHTAMVGLRFTFGMPRPVPEPVALREPARPVVVMPAPAPMRPPVMPQPVVQPPPPPVPETYIVFFDFDRYYLTAEAKETLRRAAGAFKAGHKARVEVSGHTDTAGSYRYNRRLSERRARTVKNYLVALGVPRAEIGTRGLGETQLMVKTGNNVREAKNRRAEIIMK